MTHLTRDIRYGFRMLLRYPGSSAMAVIALALGIGLVAAMTSVLSAVLFAKFPFKEADRICVPVWEQDEVVQRFTGTRSHDYEDWAEQQTSFDLFGGARIGNATISRDDIFATTLPSMAATIDVFTMSGVQPVLGRAFTPEDMQPGAEPVILISDHVWKDLLRGDPDILGTTLRVDGTTATIVGVMPPGWKFPFTQEIWQPLILDTASETRGSGEPTLVFARLAPGVTRATAKAELDAIAGRIAKEFPDSNKEYTATDVQPLSEFIFNRTTHVLLWTMMAAVVLVLIVACANVANVILSQSALRIHELAVRTAMGASRSRLVTQMLTETFILALIGAALGFFVVNTSLDLLWNRLPNDGMPYWFETGLQPMHFVQILVIAFVAAVFSGVMPALKSSGVSVREALQDSARTASTLTVGRISRALVVVQVALSCGVLIAALYMIRLTSELSRIPFPFDPETVLTARLVDSEEENTGEVALDNYLDLERLRERLETNPAIDGVGFTTAPGLLFPWNSRFRIEGEEYHGQEDAHFAFNEVVSDTYFEALGLNLVRGRGFQVTDTPDTERVVLVNTKFAEARWPGENPIGKRIKDIWKDEFPWMKVVGVVTHMGRGDNIPGFDGGCVYQYMRQAPQGATTVLIRTEDDPRKLTGFLRDTVRNELPGISIDDVYTIQESADRANSGLVFLTSIFSSFGLAAIFLASVGLYGVVSASVAQRTMEIGIRKALGATPGLIARMLARQSLMQVAIGITVGLFLGWGLSTVLSMAIQLPGNIPSAGNYIIVPLVLMGVSALALTLPALRAARVSPMQAIRQE